MSQEVELSVNGTRVRLLAEPRTTLADVLRISLRLTGTHLGCEHGVCGACTVLVDGAAVRSCLLFAVQADGCEIVTVEGLGTPDRLHPLQEALGKHHGLQCGFCTPGFLMSAYEVLQDPEELTDPSSTADALSGVLCRCTGYRGIVAAVREVAEKFPAGIPPPANLGLPLEVAGRPATAAQAPAGSLEEAQSAPFKALDLLVPQGHPTAEVAVDSTVRATVDEVWALVLDVPRVSRCLPGARLSGQLDDSDYTGTVQVRVGPMSMRFEGVVRVLAIDETGRRMELVGAGVDRRGGAARAHIMFNAAPEGPGETLLNARARLFLTGRVAQFGRTIVADVGQQLFTQFTENVEATILTGETTAKNLNPVVLLWRGLVARVRRWARAVGSKPRTTR